MGSRELTEASRPALVRGDACVVVAMPDNGGGAALCLTSALEHTPAEVPIVALLGAPLDPDSRLGGLLEEQIAAGGALWHAQAPSAGAKGPTAALNRVLTLLAPADVAVLSEPCQVSAGWLARLRAAARADTNTATASALSDVGTALALSDAQEPAVELGELAGALAEHTLALHPRLSRAVGPCVYVRREALELVGPLDGELGVRWALEVDFAQRCLLGGLDHVAADDVVVGHLAAAARAGAEELPSLLSERYPYLAAPAALAASGVLAHALEAARGPRRRLWVTIDARALDGALTGTQVHILELILALAQTGALRLRLIVLGQKIDAETLEVLRALPATEVLAAEGIDGDTPRSAVFHRPQQTFSPGDVQLALALGERIVLSQLDLIAYSNPGYFPDAGAWQDYRRASRHGMAAAERVVVFSDHTRRELLRDALVEEERIRIVAPGLDHRAPAEPRRPAALDPAPGEGEEGEPGFLLCLGTDFLHKNRVFALRLLAALREYHGWTGTLVLAGTHITHGSSLELERALLEEHPELDRAVLTLGSVGEREKAWLVANAAAVLYPSVYEGFGLVPFEAALSGVPCVFAAQSSLAEVAPAETAAIVPWDARQSAARVHALLSDPAVRAEHVSRLAAAARSLSWAAAAAALVEIYREAAVAPVRAAATMSRDAVDRERRMTALHQATAERLAELEREHDELIEEVGPARSLIGRGGALPEDLQRALLALSARPALSRPVFRTSARAFAAARAVDRAALRRLRRDR